MQPPHLVCGSDRPPWLLQVTLLYIRVKRSIVDRDDAQHFASNLGLAGQVCARRQPQDSTSHRRCNGMPHFGIVSCG
jgi:hypothetical protein